MTVNLQPTTRSRFTSRQSSGNPTKGAPSPTTLRASPVANLRENATATLGETPRPQWLPYLWARSSPGGIFPTADASAPTPTNQQPTNKN
ncbi:MAG: hypothetical protein ACHBN1_23390 [Heteroscytonema crispum UTEX LB 1556]